MAKDKVITVMCAARLPELLVKRMDAAASSGGVSRAQFIAEACRMRLDGPIAGRVVSVGTVQPPDNLPPLPYFQVESTDYPGLERKKAALREICEGKINALHVPNIKPWQAGYNAAIDDVLPIVQGKLCIVCESPMREVKGKWACADLSCGKYGVEQRPRAN
jgi:hypothetical protein